MKKINLIKRLWTDSHEKQSPQRFGRYAVMLLMLLTIGVGQMWAYWYVPGNINGTRWGKTDNNMGGDNTITFYAVAAGTYSFQLTNGSNWSGNSCIKTISGATKGTDGSNATITTTAVKDITITVVDETNWKVSVTASDPTYHIKYQFGGSWGIKTLINNGDGTYSCNGNYSGSSSSGFNYIKVSSEGDDFMNWTTSGITRENSPSSTSDKCIFTFKPSDNTLKIRKCNTVTKTNYIYFYNRHSWSDSYIYFVIGHPDYSQTYRVTNIANTKLYYVANSSDNWTDAGYYGMIGAGSSFGGGSWGQSNMTAANHYTAAYTTARNLANGKSILVTPNSTNSNGQAMTISSDMSSFTGLNYSQTVQKRTCTGANDPSTVANFTQTEVNSGTVTISAYKMTGNGTASNTSNSATLDEASETSASVDAAYSGKVTYTASANTGYTFVGWATTAVGSIASTDATYNRYPTSSGTVFARFKENQYTAYVQTYTHGSSPSPSSSTTMGQITGGSISVTPNTGYRFVNWTLNSGSGSFADANSASTTFYPTSNSQLRANIVAKTYTITLDDNGDYGGNGSATATYNSSTLSIASHATREDYRIDGYQTSGGTKVINADGSLVASISGYTDGSSNWIKDDNVTLYAIWVYDVTNYTVTYGAGTDYTSYGSVSAYNNTSSAAVGDSPASVRSGHSVTFTATPETGYEIEGWYTDAACSSGKHDAGNSTYTVVSVTGDLNVYVKFVEKTWSVAFAAGTGGTVTTPNSTPRTVGQLTGISIAATPSTGYTFNTWTITSGSGSFTSSATTNSNTFKPTAASTVTASFTEKMTTVTVNVSPAGAGTLTVASSSFTPGNTTTAGVATSRTVVATPASGKVFLDWSVSGNATGTNSTNTYTLKGNGSAGTGTLTANFGIASGWYMEGTDFGGWVRPNTATYQFARPYRGMENVFYYPASLAASSYWKVNDGTKPYSISNSSTAITKKTIYSLTEEWANSTYASSAMTNIWVVLDKSNKKLWVQDPQTFHNVNVTGADNDKGPVKVTLKTTSAITLSGNVLETTQFANGETFTVTVTPVTGYIPTITIGGNTPVTWWKEQATYTADGTMSTSDITVTISYTPTRAVRFAKTTGCKTLTATGPSSTDVEDNTKIKDGTEITFHQENSTGYTFSKWYSNNTGTSGTEYSDDKDDYTLTVSSSAYTIYPIYDETMHTVTLNSTYGGGHVELGGETVTSASAGIATGAAITAVPALGYYFTGWTGSDINNGVTIASGSTSTASITIRATADSKSITANFARRWVLAGDWLKDGGGQWDHTTNTLYPNPAGYGWVQISNLAANTEYAFKLYDNTGATHWVGYATSGQVYDYDTYRAVAPADSILVNTYPGENITLKTAAKGNYSFYYNFSSHKLYVYFPQSRKISMGTYTKSDGINSVHEGGTISAEDNDENEITDGLYVSNNGSVTFTASPKAGYIWQGWYSNRYCTGVPVATDRTHTVSSITSDVTRYALFEETLYSVKVHRNDAIETTYKVGIDSHPTINAATAPTGKIFDRWVTTGSATVEDPYASTTKITGATDDVSTVTATFKDLPKIYIDMTSATGWTPSKMYVVFYKNNGYFDGTNGTGLSSTYVINATPLEMTKMGTSKIWYYAYDPTSGDFEGQTITCVAFVDHTFAANYGNFTAATVVYRTDFSSCMNMFVVTDNTGENKNTDCYYRNTNAISGHDTKGYWRKYEEKNSGFYLNNLPGGSVEFTNEDGGNSYTAVANLDANTTYYFYLGCCNGWNWSNDQTKLAFNSDNRTRMVQPYNDVSSDGLRCKLTTTAAGYYTFSLTPQNTRQVQLSVDFPVAANDYRAVYHEKETSPTVSRPSNIIKNDQNSGTISLWLKKGTNYISFQKATLGAGGAVSWTACGSQQTVTGVAEAGIYTMTLTRDGSTYTVSTPEKYEGDLYIRTDCAPGKWADYTENKLEENAFNFKADDASTFDYYYCKWVNDAGTNVKCVIANEINVALSDTLKGEPILVSVGQPSNETLPEGANVRFSYNSVTNTLKRSYLTGSATDVFLNIIPDNEEEVYQTDGSTDMHGDAGAKNKFSDLGNWVYVLNAKVKPGATAAVKANYNSISQELIAEETTLLGGTEDVQYEIRLIYDFKTNYLMSAWMPSGNVDEAISLNSDIMIVRRGQNDANQLSFSDDGELTDVKRAYGVFEFRKTDMVSHMGSWNDYGYTYGLCMYYFSLPFDVNVSDIFGVGTMGDDWRIQFYNGKKRAEKGWFAGDGTTTFWEDVPADTVLYAYEGYLLMLNRSHFNNGSHKVWNNVTTSAYLYFPSTEPVYALDSIEKPITVPSHECTIDRFFTQDSLEYYDSETKQWKTGARNHKYVDSHWNMMGTPLFRNKAAKSIEACKVKIGEADSTLNYVYEWVPSTNSLSARQVLNTSFTFKPMFAYMVQYAGKVTFEGAAIKPAEIAARRSSEHKQYTVELELTKENQFAGRTYIELRENAVDSFMLNEDMYIMKGSKVADIYTHADGYELAANVLTINSHIVPVSVDTKSAGTYTFSMPSNFSGTVILIDKYANTRVNLAYEDYEVYLEQGAIKDRFEVEININDAPTAIDGAADGEGTLKDGKAHKFIMNDMMYILKDGVLYDARGNRVK